MVAIGVVFGEKSGREIDASQAEHLGRLSVASSTLSLVRSAQVERENESCFFVRQPPFIDLLDVITSKEFRYIMLRCSHLGIFGAVRIAFCSSVYADISPRGCSIICGRSARRCAPLMLSNQLGPLRDLRLLRARHGFARVSIYFCELRSERKTILHRLTQPLNEFSPAT
ncbi:hypothetical protein EVAR_2865_1 [Eumeta japonica]|uniref:Uncharacterized protein n=1 Tax=Eumeta variegata TaxID=151549 RepID=A0A4C1T3A6_EUMVA|nr:hypothetical protein EVAR_2865_1 [Eumeta japonica]